MKRVQRAVAVIRHNTHLGGDVALALREFDALVGVRGRPIEGRRELAAALGGMRLAYVPELPQASSVVAVLWDDAPVPGLIRLLRRSAFAQEIFVPETAIEPLQEFRDGAGVAAVAVSEFTGSAVVAASWNYIIESEGVLDDVRRSGRVRRTVDLLLEPYTGTTPSPASRKLRRAKKTTLSLSHDLHIYKAKFFPRMVRALLNIFTPAMGPVLDPFCGSGTALLEASLLGLDSIGVDIDPICQLISRTKISPFLDPSRLAADLDAFDAALSRRAGDGRFVFPAKLAAMIARRDRIDGTTYLPEISGEAAILHGALHRGGPGAANRDLLATLASDAVTKKIRYRFVGVGNGRYTIEIIKQPLLVRLGEKIERCRQLAGVFQELRDELGIKFGSVQVAVGDARDRDTWPIRRNTGLVVTSPPYLPASSGREHYAPSRALAFAVLGYTPGEHGYNDAGDTVEREPISGDDHPEAERLMQYLASDECENADPQRDAMRFHRKATPTRHYLADMAAFFAATRAALAPNAPLLLVVAHHHTFYSHRRQVIEHVVSGANLYGEIAASAGLELREEIAMELLKSAVSRARPRAKDDYFESVLLLRRREAELRRVV